MASRALALALPIMVMLCAHVSAQSSCTSALIGLMPCLSYISGNTSTLSSSCCSQLANVAQTQARCLCAVLNGGVASQVGVAINQTQALTLPGACKVNTPPVSQCNAVAGSPATSPVGTPAPVTAASAPSIPSNDSPVVTPSTPSGNSSPAAPLVPSVPSASSGSKTTPSSTGESSEGNAIKLNQCLLLSVMFLAAFASSFSLSPRHSVFIRLF